MELTILKQSGTYSTTIYQTFKSSIEKKASKTIVSKNKFIHAIKVAFNILLYYKWLGTSNTSEGVKNTKYYNKKSNKK